MQLRKHSAGPDADRQAARERVRAACDGAWDDALLFAASSILNDINRPDYDWLPIIREVRTARDVYTLRGGRVITSDGFRACLSISAEPVPPHMTMLVVYEKLRRSFRLTRKEARVAELLALHRTNEQIASELFISPHTARHHTQSVLGKLGVRSRRDVAGVLETTRT